MAAGKGWEAGTGAGVSIKHIIIDGKWYEVYNI